MRELVVDEWQGEFQENYSEFFTSDGLIDDSVAFMQEAEEYRKKGTFAGSLGDSMPLALANILKLPLMILSTKHNVPFIDICPRSVMTGAAPIFLARYNAGAGYYNAIIPNQTEQQDPPEPFLMRFPPTTSNAMANRMLSCRCNTSEGKESTKYKNRCDCIKVVGWCQPSCKCDGKCGESVCKPKNNETESLINEKKKEKCKETG